MRATIALLYPMLLLATAPAIAAEPDEPDKPVTDRSPSMGDAAATPVSDLNLKKGEIPPLLIAAQERPYHLGGLERCNQIAGAIRQLDQLLGDDLDLPQEDGQRVTAGRVAQAAVGSFIPFRGLIREVSGANTHERRMQAAIDAGIARRAFLKGYGQARGCRYPARAATLAEWNARIAAAAPAEDKDKDKDKDESDRKKERGKQPKFVSQPVIQKTNR
jgi:hypothetical protein